MRGDTLPYDHRECELEVRGRRVAAGGAALAKRGRGGGKARGRRGGGKGNGLQSRRGGRGGSRGSGRGGREGGGEAEESSGALALALVLVAGRAADSAMLLQQQNAHLQAALRTRGLATRGGKKALVARLIESYRSPQLSTHR